MYVILVTKQFSDYEFSISKIAKVPDKENILIMHKLKLIDITKG